MYSDFNKQNISPTKQNSKIIQTKIGQNQNIQISQKIFMKYYQENIKLKKQLEQRNKNIRELKEKLQKQMNLNKTFINPVQQLNKLKQQTKKTGPIKSYGSQSTNKKSTINMNGYYPTGSQSNKIQNLLQIIQSYKNKLQLAQQQSAYLRRQKTLLEQDLGLKGKRINQEQQLQKNYSKPNLQRQHQLTTKLRQKIYECENQKQRNRYYDAQMRRLQLKLKNFEHTQDQLRDLKVNNRILQQRIRNLTTLHNSNDTFDVRAIQEKSRQLQIKLKTGIQKYQKLKSDHVKLSADYKVISQQFITKTAQNQQFLKQITQLKRNQVNNPIITKLLQNQHLLAKVIGQIQSQKISNQFNNTKSQFMKQQTSAQKLILQKQYLAKELIQAQNRIKAIQQNWKQKQALLKIQKQQMSNKLQSLPHSISNKDKKNYTSKAGIPYDGDISMFTDQVVNIPKNVNYFDLFLGQLNLLQTMIHTVTNISNVSNLMILATVDFYNFNTVKSKLIQGFQCNLHSQFTFKILEDQFFFKYLNKQTFKIELWASEGNKQINIGKIQIPLKQLYMNNKPSIAPVINSSAPVFFNQKVMGTIHFDMRMRMPIYDQISNILDIVKNLPQSQDAPLKKLIIQIEEGSGFSEKSTLFVYYVFRMEDFYTNTSKGPNPKWSYYKMHDVRYNNDSKNYFRKSQIQFTIFDDSAIVYDQKDNDVLGSASIPLLALIQDNPIRQRLQIRKKGIKTGTIDVKIFWYENKQKVPQKVNAIKKQEDFIKAIHFDILAHIQNKNGTVDSEFRSLDSNRTGMISFQEFSMWFTRVKQTHKYSQSLITKYFSTFRQPVNLSNWTSRLSVHYQQRRIQQKQRRQDQLGVKWDTLKQVLYQNSKQLKNQISLEQYLKEKDLFNMSLQVDKNGNGKISKDQILKYMRDHNISIPTGQIPNEITLVQFLKRYQKYVDKS